MITKMHPICHAVLLNRYSRMATRKAKKTQGVHTIPEIRRTFEYMEEYVAKKIASRATTTQITKDLQGEWKKKFGKPLDERSAKAFIEDARAQHTVPRPSKGKRTIRHRGGALYGAPLTDTMRAGISLAPASIPIGSHLPLSGGLPSTFGSFVDYISGGFRVPEPSGNITGKFGWPQPYSTTGSNTVHMTGGRRTPRSSTARHKKRTVRGGGRLGDAFSSIVSFSSPLANQFAMRPIPSNHVPSTLQNIQSTWKGQMP
jgi:hypothetical protein